MIEWRQVPGWANYEVSEDGRVRNRAGLELKPWRLRNGRWQLHLRANGKRKAFFTYQLVALAFLGPQPFAGAEVAHRDDDKDNNHRRNLRWSTHRDNCRDRRRNGRAAVGDRNGARLYPERVARGDGVWLSKLTEAVVSEIRAAPKGGMALARQFGVSVTTIKDVRRGKTWQHVKGQRA